MTVVRGFTITIAIGLAFGCFGAIAGYLLGSIAPDNYRTVFRILPQASIDPAQAGFGLGVTQGLGAGLMVGLVIVVSVAWYKSSMSTSQPTWRARSCRVTDANGAKVGATGATWSYRGGGTKSW